MAIEPMKIYASRVFENQHIVLDDGIFRKCQFKNCTLEYSAAGEVVIDDCHFEAPMFIYRGAALRCVSLFMILTASGALNAEAPRVHIPSAGVPRK